MSDNLGVCPRCRIGKGKFQHNLSPASWIECDYCGFQLADWEHVWNELREWIPPAKYSRPNT